MNAALEAAVHATPKLYHLRTEVWRDDVVDFTRPIEWIHVFIHVIRHVAPKRESPFSELQVDPIFVTIADECAELAAHHMVVKDEKESFIEFKRVLALLHQLPCCVEKLSENG